MRLLEMSILGLRLASCHWGHISHLCIYQLNFCLDVIVCNMLKDENGWLICEVVW